MKMILRLAWLACAGMALGRPPALVYPYPPGSQVNQLTLAGGFLYAALGKSSVDRGKPAGYFLYRSRPDSLHWKEIARSDSVYSFASPATLRCYGAIGNRVFFNLEGKAQYTEDGGETWVKLEGPAFQSNLVSLDSLSYAVFANALHVSADQGKTWQVRQSGLDAKQLIFSGDTLCAIGAQFSLSPDTGRTWNVIMGGFPTYPGGTRVAEPRKLQIYQGMILCASGYGVVRLSRAEPAWRPFGTRHETIVNLVQVDDRLLGGATSRIWQYNGALAAWEDFTPSGFGMPLWRTGFDDLGGVVSHAGRWIIGGSQGIHAFHPDGRKSIWMDSGMHRAETPDFWMAGKNVATLHRGQLHLIRPEGPVLIRDFGQGLVQGIANIDRSDSAIWINSDTMLYRYSFAGAPVLMDSLSVPRGAYYCRQDTLIGIGSPTYPSFLDSLYLKVSVDAGRTFRHFGTRMSSGEFREKPASAYLRNDTVWAWDKNANYLNYRISDGSFRIVKTGIPVTFLDGVVEALHTPAGILVMLSSILWLSPDGGETWTLGTKGLPAPLSMNGSIQARDGRLFLRSGPAFYYSDASRIEWVRMDLPALSGAKGGVLRAFAADAGIVAAQGVDGYVLEEWTGITLSLPRSFRANSPVIPSTRTGRHVDFKWIFLKDGKGHSALGKRLPLP